MNKAKCRSCGASVFYAQTAASVTKDEPRFMPVDAEPSPEGNVVLVKRKGKRQTVAEVLGPLELAICGTSERYVAHFATCANPEPWMKGKK